MHRDLRYAEDPNYQAEVEREKAWVSIGKLVIADTEVVEIIDVLAKRVFCLR
jgi:hypothetical protein